MLILKRKYTCTNIKDQRVPHADKDISIPKNKEEDILLGYIMKIGTFFICKKQIGFPETLVHCGIHCQGIWAPKIAGELQPGIIPFLSQEDINSIVLREEKNVCLLPILRIYSMLGLKRLQWLAAEIFFFLLTLTRIKTVQSLNTKSSISNTKRPLCLFNYSLQTFSQHLLAQTSEYNFTNNCFTFI